MSTLVSPVAPSRPLRVAIAGNPNSGKTTIFNALTGLRQKVGNYPGVTVERREGRLAAPGGPSVVLLDLPGTYSIAVRSADEQVARDVLLGRLDDAGRPDLVVVVVDASNLERNLYLTTQIIDLHLPVIVACNMIDVAQARGLEIDLPGLSARLGVPVLPTVGNRSRGISQLRTAIQALPTAPAGRAWDLPESLAVEVRRLAQVVVAHGLAAPEAAEGAAILLLGGDSEKNVEECVTHLPSAVTAAIDQAMQRLRTAGIHDPAGDIVRARYAWLASLVADVVTSVPGMAANYSDRIDRVVTNRWAGLALFAGVMLLCFLSIFWLAEPIMGLIDDGIVRLQGLTHAVLAPGPIADLLADGIIAGVGSVVTFVPQICLLFFFIALLEDTGYMARAALIMDRLMSRVGLHGKSFIPLLSGYACAIPGIMAARTIENRRDRLATILVVPLMSCSARLPVYTLLIALVFGSHTWLKAASLFALYFLGTFAALAMAFLFKKTVLKGPTPAFLMELPPYRMPRIGAVVRVMWDRSVLFLSRAGTTILAASIILWALAYYPRAEQRLAEQDVGFQLRHSYIGRLGHLVEPVVEPLGYDWKIGVGLIASFAAREVFVSTMGVVYSVGADEDGQSEALQSRLASAAWPDGRPVFTPAVGISLMVFYVFACQCVSTIAIVRRETNSWRWPVFMVAYMSALAYIGALLAYQIGAAAS